MGMKFSLVIFLSVSIHQLQAKHFLAETKDEGIVTPTGDDYQNVDSAGLKEFLKSIEEELKEKMEHIEELKKENKEKEAREEADKFIKEMEKRWLEGGEGLHKK